jgi:hypothetical protein
MQRALEGPQGVFGCAEISPHCRRMLTLRRVLHNEAAVISERWPTGQGIGGALQVLALTRYAMSGRAHRYARV